MGWRRLVLASLGALFRHSLDGWAVSAVYRGLLSMRTTGSLVDSSPCPLRARPRDDQRWLAVPHGMSALCLARKLAGRAASERTLPKGWGFESLRARPGQRRFRPRDEPLWILAQQQGAADARFTLVGSSSFKHHNEYGCERKPGSVPVRDIPGFLIVTPVRRKIRTPGGTTGASPSPGAGGGLGQTLHFCYLACQSYNKNLTAGVAHTGHLGHPGAEALQAGQKPKQGGRWPRRSAGSPGWKRLMPVMAV